MKNTFSRTMPVFLIVLLASLCESQNMAPLYRPTPGWDLARHQYFSFTNGIEIPMIISHNEWRALQAKVTQLSNELKAKTSDIVDIGHMPTSCSDQKAIGHKMNGLFLIKGTKHVETVYCDFTKETSNADFQKNIGYVGVKSAPIFFYAHLGADFGQTDVAIPFDVIKVNVGNALGSTSGVFTAPKKGTYFFSCSGISTDGGLWVALFLNDDIAGTGFSTSVMGTFTVQATLLLNVEDKVSVRITGANDNSKVQDDGKYTHFTGWLIEEELF